MFVLFRAPTRRQWYLAPTRALGLSTTIMAQESRACPGGASDCGGCKDHLPPGERPPGVAAYSLLPEGGRGGRGNFFAALTIAFSEHFVATRSHTGTADLWTTGMVDGKRNPSNIYAAKGPVYAVFTKFFRSVVSVSYSSAKHAIINFFRVAQIADPPHPWIHLIVAKEEKGAPAGGGAGREVGASDVTAASELTGVKRKRGDTPASPQRAVTTGAVSGAVTGAAGDAALSRASLPITARGGAGFVASTPPRAASVSKHVDMSWSAVISACEKTRRREQRAAEKVAGLQKALKALLEMEDSESTESKALLEDALKQALYGYTKATAARKKASAEKARQRKRFLSPLDSCSSVLDFISACLGRLIHEFDSTRLYAQSTLESGFQKRFHKLLVKVRQERDGKPLMFDREFRAYEDWDAKAAQPDFVFHVFDSDGRPTYERVAVEFKRLLPSSFERACRGDISTQLENQKKAMRSSGYSCSSAVLVNFPIPPVGGESRPPPCEARFFPADRAPRFFPKFREFRAPVTDAQNT